MEAGEREEEREREPAPAPEDAGFSVGNAGPARRAGGGRIAPDDGGRERGRKPRILEQVVTLHGGYRGALGVRDG